MTDETCVLQAQVEQLELRVQELQAELLASRTERSEELQELHAIVDAQEAALTEQRRIIESQSALIEDLHEHLSGAVPEPPAEPEEGEAPLPPPPRRSRGESGPSTGSGARPKRSSHPSTASGYGKTVESSREQREQREQREREPPRGSGSMSTPGLRSGKLEVRKEKSEPNSRTDRRSGAGCSSAGGLGIKGPSPRMTPRSASASDRRSAGGGGAGQSGASMAGLPPSLPLLRQEA
ncbi:Uncharacterized protein SCF082_LOCUS594 [Durusdinium trenchii]|uniref:Uncharacterized protein n=1 Tax=Durusdinium trenchii TaxID=1381693 RepID=A0ABP0H9I4_9DINO